VIKEAIEVMAKVLAAHGGSPPLTAPAPPPPPVPLQLPEVGSPHPLGDGTVMDELEFALEEAAMEVGADADDEPAPRSLQLGGSRHGSTNSLTALVGPRGRSASVSAGDGDSKRTDSEGEDDDEEDCELPEEASVTKFDPTALEI
jgi:hypothetical protein